MAGNPPSPATPQPTFSPDRLWWWDGAQWRPAVSPDGTWRWDGRAWVPNLPPGAARPGGGTTAVVIAIAAFGGILLLVGLFTLVVLLTMGNQIQNVFQNVVTALGSSPSPSP